MEGGEYSSHRVRWDQDVRDYAQLTLFFCNPLTDCLPFLSGTDIRETECHQELALAKGAKKRVFCKFCSAQKQLFVSLEFTVSKVYSMHPRDAEELFFH